MSAFQSSLWDDSSSEDEYEYDMNKEDISFILMMHKIKRLKHGGYVFGREVIRRMRQDGHNRLMLNYFGPNLMYGEPYFRRQFRMSTDLFLREAI